MNPWGALEGESMRPEQELLRGGGITWNEVSALLPRLQEIELNSNDVRLEGKKLQGKRNTPESEEETVEKLNAIKNIIY